MKVIAISGWKRSGKDTAAEHLVNSYGFKRVSFADALKDLAAEEYDVLRSWFDDPRYKEHPLSKYPVEPKDGFSRTVAEFMVKEFVDSKGEHPIAFEYQGGQFFGVFETRLEEGDYMMVRNLKGYTSTANSDFTVLRQLYHCPRSLAILKGSTNRVVHPNFWVYITMNKMTLAAESDKFNATNGQYVISDLRYRSEIEGLKMFLGDKVTTVRINRFDTCTSTDPSERDLDDTKFDVVIENKGTLDELIQQVNLLAKK